MSHWQYIGPHGEDPPEIRNGERSGNVRGNRGASHSQHSSSAS